ncbi:hypothetical protein S7S_10325 [Isoalcanivorax pacificus W11-5]|uniref:DUF445 domain-containing protein n=1 Tax=Isoalcanivorax pacificus W11-5 TaxID=391936 RepID=A0A0B4XQH7_9GAMM|nr:hypothetical protein [Isoalcanivorax pacificus]AJD48477.1 hypothetical protein S7S_10325 [Isoalcanivorax pacificus W11-5]
MLESMFSHPDFWKYVSIPVLAGVIGWVTNWMAVQMTFYPLQFIGIRPFFGWQGIIPSKAEKMSGILVDQTLSKIGSIDEFFQQMEPEKIAAHLTRSVQSRIEEYTDEVMTERNAVLWENLPLLVRRRVYNRARRVVPEVMDNIVDDISKNVEELVDLKYMIGSQMREDRALMVKMFREVGDPEFRFVINSGFYFGFLFGLLQIPFVLYLPGNWVMPVFGFIIGIATNWVALNVIFRPLNPVRVGPFRVQGLFLKRQKDVAESFARLTTTEVVTLRNIMYQVINGPRADRTKALIKRHMRPLLEGGVVRTAAQLTVGPGGYADLKKAVEEKAVDLAVLPFEDPQFNRERGAIVERIMRERMCELSSEEFQALLRPAFQEDEWILILVGGVLGMAAGFIQLFLVFGMS